MTLKALLTFALSSVMLSGCVMTQPPVAQVERKHYSEWEKDVGYTQVVRVGNTLHLAGVGSEGETLIDQLHGIYRTIEDILADHSATTSDIISEVVYTTNMEKLVEAIPVRKTYFKNGEYPSSTWVQVERLFSPEMQLEIAVTVQVSDSR